MNGPFVDEIYEPHLEPHICACTMLAPPKFGVLRVETGDSIISRWVFHFPSETHSLEMVWQFFSWSLPLSARPRAKLSVARRFCGGGELP